MCLCKTALAGQCIQIVQTEFIMNLIFVLCRYNARTGIIDKNILPLDNRLVAILPVVEDGNLLICTHSTLYKITKEGKIIWQNKFPNGMVATALMPLKKGEYLHGNCRRSKMV